MSEETDAPIMSRRAVWITGLVIVVLVSGRWFVPGSAQDTTEQRIDSLAALRYG